ncbi:MAG: hypothetical protein ACRCUT_05090 [Spirochaetota bacterium]
MKKTVKNESVHYLIEWSAPFEYDRITAARILPDMPGILFISEKKGRDHFPMLCFACWREGLRSGLKDLMDELFTKFPDTVKELKARGFYYRYTVVDTTPHDMQDIMFWLINTYQPEFNNSRGFGDSRRYSDISVREIPMKKY